MARNEDNDPNDDDDQYFHRDNPSSLHMPPSRSSQLITPDQHGSLEEGGLTHYKVY
jgi:hypothetical protein